MIINRIASEQDINSIYNQGIEDQIATLETPAAGPRLHEEIGWISIRADTRFL